MNLGQQRICCPESNRSVPTVAKWQEPANYPGLALETVWQRKSQTGRPGNSRTAPAYPLQKTFTAKGRHLAPETVSQRKSQTGRPGNSRTAPAYPLQKTTRRAKLGQMPRKQGDYSWEYQPRNSGSVVTEKITDGLPRKQYNCSSVSITENLYGGQFHFWALTDVKQ